MLQDNLKSLFRLYARPVGAMSDIIDRGNWLFGALSVVVVSALLQFGMVGNLYRTYQAPLPTAQQFAHRGAPHSPPAAALYEGEDYEIPVQRAPLPLVGQFGWWFVSFSTASVLGSVVSLALLYIPLALLIISLIEHLGSFTVILQRDYAALLACTLMSWAAAHLPFALAGGALGLARPNPVTLLALWLPAKLYFGVFMVLALRTVVGASLGACAATVSVAWISVIFESYLTWLASPFILFWAYFYFRGDVGDLFSTFRTRQSYRRYLEAATVNPRDAEAHYQLGLIHQQRRQYTEAIERFKRAVEIDPDEAGAHFQLGRIARTQGRLEDALGHFQAVMARDPQHSQNEVWREIGESYLAASKLTEARSALERYVDRRSYDPEGLCYLGDALVKLGEPQAAREMFERAVEAEKTNPYSGRGHLRKWRKLAEKQLKNLRP
ncbi:MAG: tetratricopeptide repeat protein [Terriglobia bacterium]